MFSSNATPFDAGTAYAKAYAYSLLYHGGDLKAGARDLRERQYGGERGEGPEVGIGDSRPPLDKEKRDGNPEGRIFQWADEWERLVENDKWVWEGYLSRGGISLLSALPKVGKTTLLSHLLKAFASDGEFLGLPIKGSRVLYVSEESTSLWAERRDAIGIGNHVGLISRPFRSKPGQPEWQAFIGKVKDAVDAHGFDLVVFDTIAKLWPVRDENDAPSMDTALMPLWALTDRAAVLLRPPPPQVGRRRGDGEPGERGAPGIHGNHY